MYTKCTDISPHSYLALGQRTYNSVYDLSIFEKPYPHSSEILNLHLLPNEIGTTYCCLKEE